MTPLSDALSVARREYASALRGVALVTVDLTEAAAGREPALDAWPITTVLAHLVMVERNAQHYVNELVQHPGAAEAVIYPASVPERLVACLALFPSVAGLLAQLEKEQQATLAFCDALQPRLSRDPRPVTPIVEMLLAMAPHVWEHVRQVEQTRRMVGNPRALGEGA